MDRVIKAKTVSYGLIELHEHDASYYITVNGSIKEQSSDLNAMESYFDHYD
ncbi:hypothetical protein OZX72_05515 [Bifidobacterium sp. ESL0769]|uniref:hypothetical protein n=1 Tax=Bifidobacterium sp. ESL0769 TaxID=2983229 RepID=UPI0023F7F0B1|nr:hypothetical protein [Bifidobacterium sp. ESL0769]WEV66730.1 hypothetical protein OZX72_05515 [Bifidobacterium sp. ESL0769]